MWYALFGMLVLFPIIGLLFLNFSKCRHNYVTYRIDVETQRTMLRCTKCGKIKSIK